MRVFVDLDSHDIITGPGVPQAVRSLDFKRATFANLEVQFCRSGQIVELPADAAGIFEVKPIGKYDQDPVTGATSWVKTGSLATNDLIYTFVFTFVTIPLDTLFMVDVNVDNDVAVLKLMGEIQWLTGGVQHKTQTVDVNVANDVIRAGDLLPALPPVSYGTFIPSITRLEGGTPTDLDALPTVGIITGTIIQLLIDVSGELTWLAYVLTEGPATEPAPAQVEPLDYNATTNNRHWLGAVGPSGPAGVNAGTPYLWNTGTTDVDPGAGKVSVNAAPGSASELYISETDNNGVDLEDLLATWDNGATPGLSSVVRGRVHFVDPVTPANFAVYDLIGGRTDNGTWDKFTVIHVASGGTLTNNLPVMVTYVPRGDRGEQGDAGAKYLFNDDLTGDPGVGKFLFDAAFGTATTWSVSKTDALANGLGALLATLDDSTSPNKCLVTCQKSGGSGYFSFYVTGDLTDNGGYDTFPITPVSSGGTLADGDTFFLMVARVGDEGVAGTPGTPGSPGSAGATGPIGITPTPQQNYSNNVSDSDPGPGTFRFDSTTIGSVAAAYIDDTDLSGVSIFPWVDTFDDSTSAIKGTLIVAGITSPLAFAIFHVVGSVVNGTGYRKLTLVHLANGGLFIHGQKFALNFMRNGDTQTSIPQNAQPNDYTLALADSGKQVFHDHATGHIYTIPANATVAFPIGTPITIINNAGSGTITLAITSDTLRRADGTPGTGSRSIPASSMATIIKTKATEWMISGAFS